MGDTGVEEGCGKSGGEATANGAPEPLVIVAKNMGNLGMSDEGDLVSGLNADRSGCHEPGPSTPQEPLSAVLWATRRHVTMEIEGMEGASGEGGAEIWQVQQAAQASGK